MRRCPYVIRVVEAESSVLRRRRKNSWIRAPRSLVWRRRNYRLVLGFLSHGIASSIGMEGSIAGWKDLCSSALSSNFSTQDSQGCSAFTQTRACLREADLPSGIAFTAESGSRVSQAVRAGSGQRYGHSSCQTAVFLLRFGADLC